MGAEEFYVVAEGSTAQDAFTKAVEQAQYDHGHGGYTGTIAEKDEFEIFTPPEGFAPEQLVAWARDDNTDHLHGELVQRVLDLIDSKWSAAACVKLSDNSFAFFGLASS